MFLLEKRILLTLLLILIMCQSWAQNVEGTVKSKSGEPIPYATVYVKEASHGTTTNAEGKFKIELESGTYTVNFRSLGYEPQTQTINISTKTTTLDIVLNEQILQIQEVKIKGNGEDPAYAIIRKVIALSYVHLNQINSYAADVYIRGTVKFEKIPGIIRNRLKKNNIDVKSGDVLVNEVVSKIKFIAPDKYDQQIKSINSSFPAEIDFQIDDFLGSSLYQDNIDILFSPLGKNAFSYYKFTYEGFDNDKQYTVNKIRVTPKRNGKQFFEGYIYIIEDLWCLHRADLKFDTPFGEVSVKQVYDEVRPQVWLPVGHNYSFDGGMLGVKANAKFGASIKYNAIDINKQVLAMANYPNIEEVAKPKTDLQKQVEKPQPISNSAKKRNQKIEQLLEKDKLSNQDMTKLSRLMAKKDEAVKPDSLKTLELTDALKVKVDAGANKRDTTYWSEIRPIPLSQDEINSFRERDSIRMRNKAYAAMDSQAVVVHKRNYGTLNPFFFGKHKQLKDSTWRLNYEGLFNSHRISFNSVDGLFINQDVTFSKRYSSGNSLQLMPKLAYGFSRKSLMFGGMATYNYSPNSRGTLQITAEKYAYDFNGEAQGIHPFVNTIATLLFKENYARYFETRRIDIYNGIDIANGLVLRTKLEWKDNRELENTTDFSIFKNGENYSPNIPKNAELKPSNIEDQINTIVGIRLEYTPHYYYHIRNGRKRMAYSNWPTFHVKYEKGINNFLSSVADYDFIGGGIHYGRELTTTSSIMADFDAGWFPNNKQIHFSDFAHSPTQTTPVMLKEHRHAFFLPGYYELSTADQYLHAHLSYKSPFIALKYLPILSNTLWREMVWAGYYTSPQYRNYVEVGYTLLEVLLSANVGVYAGFDDGKFNRIGFNIAFRWAN